MKTFHEYIQALRFSIIKEVYIVMASAQFINKLWTTLCMLLKKLIINMYSAMYCMFKNYTNNLPLQNSESVTGDSNADIDGENVPVNVKSRLCYSIEFNNLH